MLGTHYSRDSCDGNMAGNNALLITKALLLLLWLPLLLAFFAGPSTTAAAFETVPDTPSYHDPWTSRSHREAVRDEHDRYGRKSSSNSRNRGSFSSLDGGGSSRGQLEGQASREIREAFGDEFARQLEEEDEIVRSIHEHKARVGREAGCSESSPLSSSSLPAEATWDLPQ